ncbi:hypothetical protein HHI36_012737, partial [Cryptolaemus montrouzieri]
MFRSTRQNRLMNEIPTIVVNSPSDEIQVSETSLSACAENQGDRVDGREQDNSTNRCLFRRNSISLPNLDDLQIIKEQVE